MEAGMQVDDDPNDVTVQHMSTDWDIQKRGEYERNVAHASLCIPRARLVGQ